MHATFLHHRLVERQIRSSSEAACMTRVNLEELHDYDTHKLPQANDDTRSDIRKYGSHYGSGWMLRHFIEDGGGQGCRCRMP
jgi:hypothetical protein